MAAELPRPGAKKKAKQCARCSKPSKRFRCDDCMEKARLSNKIDYRKRISAGQCVCCSVIATAGAFCFKHWLKNLGLPHGLTIKNGGVAVLEQLWRLQGGLCAVTGEQLIPGVNASLDHILPVSKGGLSVSSNLRWVTLNVNHMKWDMTDEEFLRLCKLIVNRATRGADEVVTVLTQIDRSN